MARAGRRPRSTKPGPAKRSAAPLAHARTVAVRRRNRHSRSRPQSSATLVNRSGRPPEVLQDGPNRPSSARAASHGHSWRTRRNLSCAPQPRDMRRPQPRMRLFPRLSACFPKRRNTSRSIPSLPCTSHGQPVYGPGLAACPCAWIGGEPSRADAQLQSLVAGTMAT